MHEASIMQEVFEIAFQRMRREGALRIHRLNLRVGVLSGVVPEALTFAFEALKTNTPAAEAQLELEEIPALLYCPACQLEFPSDTCLDLCPGCGGWQTEVRQGRELELAHLELSSEE